MNNFCDHQLMLTTIGGALSKGVNLTVYSLGYCCSIGGYIKSNYVGSYVEALLRFSVCHVGFMDNL